MKPLSTIFARSVLVLAMSGMAPAMAQNAPAPAPAPQFTPPDSTAIPDDEFGKMVRKGQDIFLKPSLYAGKFVGNDLSCASCHMDAGRRADAGRPGVREGRL